MEQGLQDPANPAGSTVLPWSVRMADAVMARDGPLLSSRWHYEPGVALLGLSQVWLQTRERAYFDFIKSNIDEFVSPDGEIETYRLEDYNLDQINEGKLLLFLYEATGDERYKKAAFLLRRQLQSHPRTRGGGLWHKQIYPHQMWLDGIYMASPFLAEFATRFDEPEVLDDVAHQIALIERHTRDPDSGLMFHAWDESRRQRWANPETGCSPNFWGRAMAWYAMALADVLGFFPEDHLKRGELTRFSTLVSAVTRVQDHPAGCGISCWIREPGRATTLSRQPPACLCTP